MSLVKSSAVGNGDMFYIKHNTDNFTIIDCSMSPENHRRIVTELKNESFGKNIIRFISTHPDDDHIRDLEVISMAGIGLNTSAPFSIGQR
jgi:hypothetical protein